MSTLRKLRDMLHGLIVLAFALVLTFGIVWWVLNFAIRILVC